MSKKTIQLPLSGRCQCGEISYQVTAMPLTLYACHCTECQKQSSSGFGMSMPVPKSGFSVSGQPAYWQRPADDGQVVNCAFCPNCGTRLFHLPMRNQAIVNVKPGTLDNTQWLTPVGHLWTRSAQSGTTIPEDRLRYSQQPESFELLFQAWQSEYDVQEI